MFSVNCSNIFALYPKLKILQNELLSFWKNNPPSICHGYSHSILVAIKSYDLAVINSLDRPDLMFIAGLLHDIGRSDDDIITKTPSDVLNIIYKIIIQAGYSEKDASTVIKIIPSHETNDSDAILKNPEEVLLFFPDKSDHLIQRGVSFIFLKNIPLEKAIFIFNIKKQKNVKTMNDAIIKFNTLQGLLKIKKDYLKDFAKFQKTVNQSSFNYTSWANKYVKAEIKNNRDLLKSIPTLTENDIEKILMPYFDVIS